MKEYLTYRNHYDVDYCKYSDWGYKKRTRIWTNKENFNNKLCKYDCNNMLDERKHKIQVTGRGTTTLAMRYRVPPNLIKELILM